MKKLILLLLIIAAVACKSETKKPVQTQDNNADTSVSKTDSKKAMD